MMDCKSTYEKAASTIEAFLEGSGDAWDWDDFTSVRAKDAFLEDVREKCVRIRDDYPPKEDRSYCSEEGVSVLRSIAREIRERISQLR